MGSGRGPAWLRTLELLSLLLTAVQATLSSGIVNIGPLKVARLALLQRPHWRSSGQPANYCARSAAKDCPRDVQPSGAWCLGESARRISSYNLAYFDVISPALLRRIVSVEIRGTPVSRTSKHRGARAELRLQSWHDSSVRPSGCPHPADEQRMQLACGKTAARPQQAELASFSYSGCDCGAPRRRTDAEPLLTVKGQP